MQSLNEYHKHSLIRRINFIEQELKDLESYKKIDLSEYQINRRLQKEVERTVEIIANACIDIAKIILSTQKTSIPETYTEVFLKLSDINLISKDLTNDLVFLAKARNILAHHYIDIRWELIENTIKSIDKIQEFLKIIKLRFLT